MTKHKYKDIEGSRREFSIEIPSQETRQKLDRAYEELGKTTHIPGFRKGKAPRELLEKHHGKAVQEKILGDLISDSYRETLRESNTIPVGLPEISQVEFKEGKDISYKATIDIRPKVDLANYKNIKVKKKPIDVKDEDVERYLSMLQESYAQFISVEDRPSQLGDYLICDVICQIDGKPIHKEQKNILFFLNKDHSIPELVDGLVGVKKKDKKEIRAKLPENNEEPKYSKKEALFKIKVNEVKEKKYLEINDEFVKNLGRYENLSQLKEAVKKDLIRKEENTIRVDMTNQILEELLKDSHLSAPQGLVDEETERIVQNAKEELGKKNLNQDQIKTKIAELQEGFKKEAIKRVRLFFILDEIARLEGIDISDDEIEETLNLLAQQSNSSIEKVKKYYQQNDLIGHLKNQLKENKVIGFLFDNANIRQEKDMNSVERLADSV